ncbi:MAG: peptide ABC transporter substrate-binding protein [Cyanobacteria bacterium CRU_2_1]|nr:peptide ABC transporter substrate-binding protein [Cyanobacteria bacterium RU_5_0]NJR62209.1 peptide ABC transporter substrate-binding protein [Cyanobacteria bacterium CRU_2_1]
MNVLRVYRKWRSLLKFLALFSLCLVLAASCGTSQSNAPNNQTETAVTSGDRVTIGTTLEVKTLDPADAYEIFPGVLLYNLGDRLYTYQPGTTELVPQLATTLPEVSDDGLTYKIPLREGVTFHDGSPFNAEAMAFSIQRFMENGGRPAFLLADQIESAEATGDYELTITVKQPFAAFPALLTFSGVTPVPPSAYELGSGKFKPDSFVGTGPYKLASLSPDSVKLDVNDQYWGEKPANQGIDIQIISSAANLFNTFKTGGLDVVYQTLDPDQIRTLIEGAEQGGWQVIEADTNTVNYLVMNVKSEPLDEVKVRQAIAAMIDRKLLVDRVFQGQAEPLYSLIPTNLPEYKPVFEQEYGASGDFDKAKTLLTEAGFSESNPLPLEIWHSSTSTTRSLVASTLKASIEQQFPGLVNVKIDSVEAATIFDNLDKGTYPTVMLDWYADYVDADSFMQPFMSCDKGSVEAGCEEGQSQLGGSFYYSDRANQLIKQERAEQDTNARKTQFEELQDLLATDVPYIPLWQNKDYIFAKSGIEGTVIQPTQQILLGQIKKS